ncbi:hypothetical protein [Rhodococcus erythropolis]
MTIDTKAAAVKDDKIPDHASPDTISSDNIAIIKIATAIDTNIWTNNSRRFDADRWYFAVVTLCPFGSLGVRPGRRVSVTQLTAHFCTPSEEPKLT